jgi:hypothetical protein
MYIIRYKVINNIRIRRIKVADMYSLSIKWKKSLLKGDLWNVLRIVGTLYKNGIKLLLRVGCSMILRRSGDATTNNELIMHRSLFI